MINPLHHVNIRLIEEERSNVKGKKHVLWLKKHSKVSFSESSRSIRSRFSPSVFFLENVKQLTRINSYLEANLVPFCPTLVISVEYLTRTECRLKRCNSMCSEMRT